MRTKLLGSEKRFYFLLITVMVFVFCPSVRAQSAVAEDSIVSTEQVIEENVTPEAQEQLQSGASQPNEAVEQSGVSIKEFLIFLVICCSWSWFVINVLGKFILNLLPADTSEGEELACLLFVAVVCAVLITWVVSSLLGYHEALLTGFLTGSWMFVFILAIG